MNNAAAISHTDLRIPTKRQVSEVLPAADLNEFHALAHFVSFPPGAVLFAEQETPEEVFVILEGRVKLSVNSMNGKRFLLRVVEPGEVIGLASALTGTPYEMTAEAMYLSEIGSIKLPEFLYFLADHPALLRSAALSLANSYNQACERFRILGGTPSVTAKVARLLLELASDCGWRTENGTKLHLSLTHTEIGECIGACRESVSRSFRDLRTQGLMAIHGSIVTITDLAALEIYAGR